MSVYSVQTIFYAGSNWYCKILNNAFRFQAIIFPSFVPKDVKWWSSKQPNLLVWFGSWQCQGQSASVASHLLPSSSSCSERQVSPLLLEPFCSSLSSSPVQRAEVQESLGGHRSMPGEEKNMLLHKKALQINWTELCLQVRCFQTHYYD